MARYRPLKLLNFIRHEQGATAVEFAMVASTFMMLSMGIIEYGLVNYMKVATQSVAAEASRYASIGTVSGTCADRACSVTRQVTKMTRGFINSGAVRVDARVLASATGTGVPKPDVCLISPNNPYPASCAGSQFIDNDGNGVYNQATALDDMSLGAPGDLVEIRVTYVWDVLFPIMKSYIGDRGSFVISSTTVIRNEPI